MAEKNDYISVDLTKVDLEEKVTTQELESSKDISRKVFIGKAVCVVSSVDAKKESMTYAKPPYVCLAVLPEFMIQSVLEMEMPVFENGEPLMKNGSPVLKVRKLSAEEQVEANLKFANVVLSDTILLYHEHEKVNTRRRRLNIAQVFELAPTSGGTIPAARWLDIRNKKIVITANREEWTPKGKTEVVVMSKVAFDGYTPFNMAVDSGTTENFDDL